VHALQLHPCGYNLIQQGRSTFQGELQFPLTERNISMTRAHDVSNATDRACASSSRPSSPTGLTSPGYSYSLVDQGMHLTQALSAGAATRAHAPRWRSRFGRLAFYRLASTQAVAWRELANRAEGRRRPPPSRALATPTACRPASASRASNGNGALNQKPARTAWPVSRTRSANV